MPASEEPRETHMSVVDDGDTSPEAIEEAKEAAREEEEIAAEGQG